MLKNMFRQVKSSKLGALLLCKYKVSIYNKYIEC